MIRHIIIFIILSSFIQLCTANNSKTLLSAPYPSLWNANDNKLQSKLESVVKSNGLYKAVKNNDLSLVLVDISNLQQPKLAHFNGNKMFYAASLPKIAILLAAFVEIEQGNIKETHSLNTHLVNMIRFSNNKSASHVLSLVGKERVLDIIQDPKFALYDTRHNGGIWVGKAYAKVKAYRRDPISNLSHGATAIQVARFFYLLETGQLLNQENSKKLKKIMGNPGIKHKFVKGLQSISGIKIYRKSGSWRNFHADGALVEYKNYKYILIGLSNSSSGGKWLTQIALPLHNLIVNE